MNWKLANVKVKEVNLHGRIVYFVGRVYKVTPPVKPYLAFVSDSSFDCKEHAHARKVEIIKSEMLQRE